MLYHHSNDIIKCDAGYLFRSDSLWVLFLFPIYIAMWILEIFLLGLIISILCLCSWE